MAARNDLYEAYKRLYQSTSIDKEYILTIIRIQLDQAKERLVTTSDVNQLLQVQGEAKVLDKILRQMTTAPPTNQE